MTHKGSTGTPMTILRKPGSAKRAAKAARKQEQRWAKKSSEVTVRQMTPEERELYGRPKYPGWAKALRRRSQNPAA